MGNIAFTLYEVVGYVLPGSVTFLGFVIFYWTVFVPRLPLGIASFQAGPVTWVTVVLASYLLGHAAQAIANTCFSGIESSVLATSNGTAPEWMRERARQAASEILKVDLTLLEPESIFATLDEYTAQNGEVGDRDLFVYREGFYRGTALALFFLSATLLARMCVPGASIMFIKGQFFVSWWEPLITAAIVGGVGYLFVRRYKRFAKYRVTHAVLAALTLQSSSLPEGKSFKFAAQTSDSKKQ